MIKHMPSSRLSRSASRSLAAAALFVAGWAGCGDSADLTAAGGSAGSLSGSGGDAGGGAGGGGQAQPANILVVIADDLGVTSSVCHEAAADPAKAPRIQELCARGVVFDNAWSAPTCSPTRASILTGRHGFRTGVGTQITDDTSAALGLSERTLPQAIEAGAPGRYAAACIGKWHVSNASNGGADHPGLAGFPYYAGSWSGGLPSYTSWPRTVNGVTAMVNEYATTVQVNDARDFIASAGSPWFVWLAFNAPHAPFHLPPLDLHSHDSLEGQPIPNKPVEHYHAMIEAMDTEIGRLLDGLAPGVLDATWVIFLGDNGAPPAVTMPPLSPGHAKDSLYQGGVHVPLVIAGPGVVGGGRHVDAVVHVLDLFESILELAQVDRAKAVPEDVTVDSVSLVPYLTNPDQAPLRSWVMTELFGSTTAPAQNGKAIRDESFKLLRYEDGHDELHDLRTDPQETIDLIATGPLSAEANDHRVSLEAALADLLASP